MRPTTISISYTSVSFTYTYISKPPYINHWHNTIAHEQQRNYYRGSSTKRNGNHKTIAKRRINKKKDIVERHEVIQKEGIVDLNE